MQFSMAYNLNWLPITEIIVTVLLLVLSLLIYEFAVIANESLGYILVAVYQTQLYITHVRLCVGRCVCVPV